MTTTTNGKAAGLLEEWLAHGRLAPRYTESSFYRGRDFATGIDPVACGMLALARAGGNVSAAYPNRAARLPLPLDLSISGPAQMVMMLNDQGSTCKCPVAHSDTFGYGGQLGLRAVTLQSGFGYQGTPTAQLNLVLPVWTNNPESVAGGYNVVSIKLDGYAQCEHHKPYVHESKFLKYAAGLGALDEAIAWRSSGTGLTDSAVGFPGAVDYLADGLPKLGEYLVGLAAVLDPAHQH